MEKVLEELRREVRKMPGVTVYFSPIQNLRLGGAHQQGALPVRAAIAWATASCRRPRTR